MKHPDAVLVANARVQFEDAARMLRLEVADATGGNRVYSSSMLQTALQRFREAEVLLLRIEARQALPGKRET